MHGGMKVFVTGGGGFLGAALISNLTGRGVDVVALARSRATADRIAAMGAVASIGDVTDGGALRAGMTGADVVYHVAGVYAVGIKTSDRAPMFRANVDGTRAVIDAVTAAGAPRILYVSTVGVFGDTHGQVVDETYVRPDRDFVSYYDETKFLAHQIAEDKIAAGAPVVIAQPGAIYGPGDHSELGAQIAQVRAGKYRVRLFPELGVTMCHVDDVAEGLVLAAEKGKTGEAYVLGNDLVRLGDLLDQVSDLTNHPRPRLTMPALAIRAVAPLGPVVGPLVGVGPDLRETIRASDGVTYWASCAKARRELGYAPRALALGLQDLLAAG
jgi:nucleoside-diphosphate-sugar epimerase